MTSAFFFAYVPGHILSGWLVEKFNAYRTLTWGLAAWSLATFLTGWAGGFASLLIMRLLLGLGEARLFPPAPSCSPSTSRPTDWPARMPGTGSGCRQETEWAYSPAG
ncbi:MAG: MFS transporter [Gammaproteobacteria bacterium]|nr:MFS transporter [Gammaproteobacteria bacterium]